MDQYNGMDISLLQPIAYLILFSLLCCVLLVMTALFIYCVASDIKGSNRAGKKNKERIKRLEEKAEADAFALTRLEKLRKKAERRVKRRRPEIIKEISLAAVFIAILAMSLSFTVIPISVDLIKKDYVLYEGEIKVSDGTMRHAYIELRDGTVLKGNSIFYRSDTHGRIVYTKRSKLILAAEK